MMLANIVFLLFTVVGIECNCLNKKRLIIVKKSEAAVNTCRNADNATYCNSMDDVIPHGGDLSNTCIMINENQNLLWRFAVDDIVNLTITAPQSGYMPDINITCTSHAKLSFTDSVNIAIKNVLFYSCGGYKSNDYFVDRSIGDKVLISSALYMRNVTNFTMISTQFLFSRGYAAVIIDGYGLMLFKQSFFSRNILVSPHSSVDTFNYGGGVFITYSPNAKQITNTFTFTKCQFEFNDAIKGTTDSTFSFLQPFGNGGGLSIILANYSYVSIRADTETTFINNTALWGGGLYVAISKTTHNTSLNFDSVRFTRNSADYSGGAIRVLKQNFTNNVFYLNRCWFNLNIAEIGGALCQVYNQFATSKHVGYDFVLKDPTFKENMAKLGAAIYFENTNALIFGGRITENSIAKKVDSSIQKLSTVSGVGAVYVYKGEVIIGNNLLVDKNFNTAFVFEHSNLWFDGEAEFKDNKGSYGGAIALYEDSQIILTNKTDVTLKTNNASKGGAMYVHLSWPPLPLWDSPELLLYKCFIKFDSTSLSRDFCGKMNFSHNTAIEDNGNDIFATTIQSCVEYKSNNISNIITNWKGFFFTNPEKAISTEPVSINITDSQWSEISPGMTFNPTIQLFDERHNSVSGPIDINIESGHVHLQEESSRKIVYKETIDMTLVTDQYRSKFSATLNSPSGRPIPENVINQTLNFCPFGYRYSQQIQKCICFNSNQDRMISKCIGKDIYLYNNVWATSNDKDDELTFVCPPGYCKICNKTKNNLPSIDCKYEPKSQCDKTRDQNSNLCGSCLPGYAVVFGSEKCQHCINTIGKYWIPFAIFAVVAVIVFFILIFNLDVYEDFFNATIFFYQCVDLLFTPTQQIMTTVGKDEMKFIIGIIKLNGIHIPGSSVGTCFSETFDDADKLMINYLIPLSMILSLVLFILLSNSRLRFIRQPMNQIKSCRAFIFIMVIAYCDIVRITFNLLQSVDIDDAKYLKWNADIPYFEGKHRYYGLVAVLILIFVVVGFPLSLILSSLDVKLPWLSNILLKESFNFCFKNKYQVFSVYYILARVILLSIETIPKTQLQTSILGIVSFLFLIIFASIQPYTNKWYNRFDIAILFCFTVVAFCSNGKLKLDNDRDQMMGNFIQTLVWLPLCFWFIAIVIKYCQLVCQLVKNLSSSIWNKIKLVCTRNSDL